MPCLRSYGASEWLILRVSVGRGTGSGVAGDIVSGAGSGASDYAGLCISKAGVPALIVTTMPCCVKLWKYMYRKLQEKLLNSIQEPKSGSTGRHISLPEVTPISSQGFLCLHTFGPAARP